MKKYINLNRSFALIPTDIKLTEDDLELNKSFDILGLSRKQKWSQLLQLRRVIILAEAGAGKTWEIREATERLRNEGKHAFFFRLEIMCLDFDASFEIGTKNEFTKWLSSSEQAWFFLDSVDEARLGNPKNFEIAIRNFAIKIGDNKQRAYIYITSRVSEWRPQSDLRFPRYCRHTEKFVHYLSELEVCNGRETATAYIRQRIQETDRSADC